jgi:hypothetical protein
MDDTTDEVMDRIAELAGKGYFCSQVLITLALDAQGKSDPDLVRTMDGIAHGCWYPEGQCGAWSGGACLIALYAGKGTDDEEADDAFLSMLADLGKWFIETVTERYGGITCGVIMAEKSEIPARCRRTVRDVYEHVVELLMANGYDLTQGK